MIAKSPLSKIVILSVAGMAFLTQPVQSYESGLAFRLPAVGGTAALGTNVTMFWIAGPQKHIHAGIDSNYYSKKDVEVPVPDGAAIMISSVPVVIQNQVSKNIFMVNIPDDNGGYSSVVLQKSGNRFIGLSGEFLPDFSEVL